MRKNAILGILFIVLAVCIVLNSFNLIPEIPVIRLGISAILVAIGVEGIRKRDFLAITVPLAIIACMFSDELHIDSIPPFTIIVVAFFLGIGLQLIFKGKPIVKVESNFEFNSSDSDSDTLIIDAEAKENGRFHIENGFGSSSQYINVQGIENGHIENTFGNLNVYFDGSTVSEAGGHVHVENGFGNINLYIPASLRVSVSQDSGIGRITQYGQASSDASLPVLNLFIENGLGNVNIYFN